ncbi:hypothetical protein [Nocardia bovistercoris]|uniref:Uncharacterized protein n=1 Tax=Nocardia bovistercoris TaxID=2785916 RepID=A0A931IFA3_9NOCA|nr:hypothetical protein [Nocardia bovistercoris]MBH0779488.1 hypothetical protein [Nocardia bovistercoris]
MIEPVQVSFSTAEVAMPSLSAMHLVDTTNGDNPDIRMPARMSSVVTSQFTARSVEGAVKTGENLA